MFLVKDPCCPWSKVLGVLGQGFLLFSTNDLGYFIKRVCGLLGQESLVYTLVNNYWCALPKIFGVLYQATLLSLVKGPWSKVIGVLDQGSVVLF